MLEEFKINYVKGKTKKYIEINRKEFLKQNHFPQLNIQIKRPYIYNFIQWRIKCRRKSAPLSVYRIF